MYIIVSTGAVWAVDFAGGTGEPNDPYQIAMAEQLIAIGKDPNLQGQCYVLVADIDLAPRTFDKAVLNLSGSAVFDGNGHTIQNLVIEAPEQDNIGLFGTIENGVTIKNLILENIHVVGRWSVGGFVGSCYGQITGCSADGTVTGHSDVGGLLGYGTGKVIGCDWTGYVTGQQYDVGGLVGSTGSGFVERCTSNGIVVGQYGVGGLVGSGSIIISCHSSGIVLGQQEVGGLVGTTYLDLTESGVNLNRIISKSFSDALVNGESDVGGLVGKNWLSLVRACYATGSAMGRTTTGALVGTNHAGVIESCYATGASNFVGDNSGVIYQCFGIGSLLREDHGGTVRSSYYLTTSSNSHYSSNEGTALTADEVLDPASFKGWDFYGMREDGYADHWYMAPNRFPTLSWQSDMTGLQAIPFVTGLPIEEAQGKLVETGFAIGSTNYEWHHNTTGFPPYYSGDGKGYGAIQKDTVVFTTPQYYASPGQEIALTVSLGPYDWTTNQGRGSAKSPYIIETPGQLDCLGDQSADSEVSNLLISHFILANDIDMNHFTYHAALFGPNRYHRSTYSGNPFGGTFDGNGHRISNLTMTAYDDNYVGLFGMLDPNAVVRDLMLDHFNISGQDYIGALAGWNEGTIVNVDVTATMQGNAYLGGLVGYNAGAVADSDVNLTLNEGNYYLGGVIGYNAPDEGTHENCSSTIIILDYGDDCVGEITGNECPPVVTR